MQPEAAVNDESAAKVQIIFCVDNSVRYVLKNMNEYPHCCTKKSLLKLKRIYTHTHAHTSAHTVRAEPDYYVVHILCMINRKNCTYAVLKPNIIELVLQ